MALAILVLACYEIFYDYSFTEQEQDIVERIHKQNLKAVQLLNERFTFVNWGLRDLGEYPFSRCKEKRCYAFKPYKFIQRAYEKSDGVMVHAPNLFYLNKNFVRNKKQLWLFYTMESQVNICSSFVLFSKRFQDHLRYFIHFF
jgi:hypothetical protein